MESASKCPVAGCPRQTLNSHRRKLHHLGLLFYIFMCGERIVSQDFGGPYLLSIESPRPLWCCVICFKFFKWANSFKFELITLPTVWSDTRIGGELPPCQTNWRGYMSCETVPLNNGYKIYQAGYFYKCNFSNSIVDQHAFLRNWIQFFPLMQILANPDPGTSGSGSRSSEAI